MKSKKRRNKTESIFKQPEGHCFLCDRQGLNVLYGNLERHHIYFGCDHAQAEKYGFTINLCLKHHRGDIMGDQEAVHSPDKNDNDAFLKRWAQTEYEKTHSRAEFMAIFSRSWL